MADIHPEITPELRTWIEAQHLFFVASAPLTGDGHVNVSPKGMDCLRVLDAHTVAYLDMTGSGNETSAHITEAGNGRLTMMWCAVKGPARILRLYGTGEVVLPGDANWPDLHALFPNLPGTRQIIINHVSKVQTSCGYAVPLFDFIQQRDTLSKYWVQKADQLDTYHREKNAVSLDGLPTPIGQRANATKGD